MLRNAQFDVLDPPPPFGTVSNDHFRFPPSPPPPPPIVT